MAAYAARRLWALAAPDCPEPPAGPLALRGAEWLAGVADRVDADGVVLRTRGLSVWVEDCLPGAVTARQASRLYARLPAALRCARALHVLGRPAPGRPRVNANAHADTRTLWIWAPHGAPQLDLTTLAHELAHLLVPEPGGPQDAAREAFLAAWLAVIEADRPVLAGHAVRDGHYRKPRPGADPLCVDLSLDGGPLRPWYAPAWRVEEDYAESVALFVRDAVEGGLGLLELADDDPRQRLATLAPARAAACAALLAGRDALAASA